MSKDIQGQSYGSCNSEGLSGGGRVRWRIMGESYPKRSGGVTYRREKHFLGPIETTNHQKRQGGRSLPSYIIITGNDLLD